ncbi:hypothetical protein LLH03_11330 [bacterium]|nr:hypothetical protein [bacterium]
MNRDDDLKQRLRAVELSKPGLDLSQVLEGGRVRDRARALRPLRWMTAAAVAAWLLVLLGGDLTARDLRHLSNPGSLVTQIQTPVRDLAGLFARRLALLDATEPEAAAAQPPAPRKLEVPPEPAGRRGEGPSVPRCEGDDRYA